MGCANSQQSKRHGVPIGNSLIHLLQTNQTQAIKKRIDLEPPEIFQESINFRGDTIAHYICLKNNYELAQHLYKKNEKYFSKKNNFQQLPVDMTTDTRIQKLLAAYSKTYPNEIVLKTAQSRKSMPRTQNLPSMFQIGREQQLPVDLVKKESQNKRHQAKTHSKPKQQIIIPMNVQENPQVVNSHRVSQTTQVTIQGHAYALNNSIRPKRMSNLTKMIKQNIQSKRRQFQD